MAPPDSEWDEVRALQTRADDVQAGSRLASGMVVIGDTLALSTVFNYAGERLCWVDADGWHPGEAWPASTPIPSSEGTSVSGFARPYLRPGPHASNAPHALTAVQVASAYRFPEASGAGQTIAIIELGGGYTNSDLRDYFDGLSLPVPVVTAVGVQGARNAPGDDADAEVLLDIQVAGAVAPGAAQFVYFAPNTDAGFLAAINQAVDATPTPCAISISWGGPETSWTAQSLAAYDAAFARAVDRGIVVLCAAGDAGADDGTRKPVADFPASSPHVIACGGTRLTVTTAGEWFDERVWDDGASSASGGGYSASFPRPAWQPASVGAHRGLPDITGNADPQSGYRVVINGEAAVIGGTSAVAPLLAGLVARLAQLGGKPVGSLVQVAYANPQVFTDITFGGNEGYSASTGWDAASGLGSAVGSKLLAVLGGGATPTQPTPPAPPIPPVIDPDVTLWTTAKPWAQTRHSGPSATVARALRTWAGAHGLG